MARLTIEDQWWTDPRREKLADLVGGLMMADAVVIRLWRAAQEFWGSGKKPMPRGIFEALPHHGSIVEAGLASVEADLVYVRGTTEHQTWLAEKRAAAAAGGKASAASRKKKTGSAQPKSPKQTRSTSEANPKTLEPSGSDSGSGSLPIPTESGAVAAPPAPRGKNAVALWLEAYHRKYRVRYPDMGKDHGTLTKLEKRYSGPELEVLFACYLAIPDPLYEKQSHPLSLFFRDLPKISLAAQTGKDPTAPKIVDVSQLED